MFLSMYKGRIGEIHGEFCKRDGGITGKSFFISLHDFKGIRTRLPRKGEDREGAVETVQKDVKASSLRSRDQLESTRHFWTALGAERF